MLGYHDCPPHLFESLADPRDAKWREDPEVIRKNIQRSFDKTRKEMAALLPAGGVRFRRG